jgi:RNA polymerase sigma-70 factor, ECF subfamily
MNESEMTTLIDRAKRRDVGAFDALIDAFGPRLFGYFVRCVRSRDDAEDLLQEVFLRVVRTIDRYEHRQQFDAWIFRIAANLVRDRSRRESRAPTLYSFDDEDRADESRQVATGRRRDAAEGPGASSAELDRAMDQLNPGERDVLLLRHFSGMSFVNIADVLGLPLGTVLAKSHRAIGKLRVILEPQS